MQQHVQHLFDGPIDIVADIHGEISALHALIGRLGYTRDGKHPRGRRLVFLGDLVDRGEDSPAVVECVADMVVAGRALDLCSPNLPKQIELPGTLCHDGVTPWFSV